MSRTGILVSISASQISPCSNGSLVRRRQADVTLMGRRKKINRRSSSAAAGVLVKLFTILAGSLGLLAAFDAGAFVVFTLPDLGQHSGLGATALEAFQRAFQRFVFFHTDFRHYISLPPARREDPLRKGHIHGFNEIIILLFRHSVKSGFENSTPLS